MDKKEHVEKIIGEYEKLLERIWKEGISLFGKQAIRLIFEASIKRVSYLFGFIKNIKIYDDKINLAELNNFSESPEKIKKGLQALVSEILMFFNIFLDSTISNTIIKGYIFKDKKDFYEFARCSNI